LRTDRHKKGARLSSILVYLVPGSIFTGGILLILFATRILTIGSFDFLNSAIGRTGESIVAGTVGLILILASVIVMRWIKLILRRNSQIVTSINHHVRNRLQTVILDLDLLKEANQHLDGHSDESVLIDQARQASLNLLRSLEDITSEDKRIYNQSAV
jgi:hypothetical protein